MAGDAEDPTFADGANRTFVEPIRRRKRKDLEPGATVGRYVVVDVLGRGGMGIVYLANDPQLDRKVALKLLLSSHDDKATLVREAKALAKLSDPHVVAVYDAGEVEDRVFLAMQYVDGEDLAKALERRQPGIQQRLAWFVDAGRGLVAAHAAGMVHRDFKPRNVLIDRKGHVAVTDFGLADDARPEPGRRRETAAGAINGTPAYMAPEQFNGERASEASDQFAFCVSLWNALFGRHPYIFGDASELSPYAISVAIREGELIPAPRRSGVKREVVDALVRGLARDPAERWPSMQTLLDGLAPRPRRRVWPIVAVGSIAALATAAIVWSLATRATEPSCASDATARTASAWSSTSAKTLSAQFARSGRSYAERAATELARDLDGYATRLQQLAIGVCSAGHAAHDANATELVARQRACLETRLDALHGLAQLVTTEDRASLVDHAADLVSGLPDLGDCAAAALRESPDAPPAAIAAQVLEVQRALDNLSARMVAGEARQVQAETAELLERAHQLGWAPLEARAYFVRGNNQLALLQPARAELLAAAELAMKSHLERDAARALALAQRASGKETSVDALATLVPLARATAARTGDRVLEVSAEIERGRGLTRVHHYREAASACEPGYAAAQTLDDRDLLDRARDCLMESLVPLGRWTELDPLIEQSIAERSKRFGPDHPMISDFLIIKAAGDLRRGRVADARKETEHALEIRRRAYPPNHFKIIDATLQLAEVIEAEGDADHARELDEQALAGADVDDLSELVTLMQLHLDIGMIDAGKQGAVAHASAISHLQKAVALARDRVGPNSLELASALIGYGQVQSEDDVDVSLRTLEEARAIFASNHDSRAAAAGTAMALIAVKAKRFEQARAFAEPALAQLDANAPLNQVGFIKWSLAQALAETHGDPARTRQLALDAKAAFLQLGPAFAGNATDIDAFLAKHK